MAELSVTGLRKRRRERQTLTITDQLDPNHKHHPLSTDLELSLNYNT